MRQLNWVVLIGAGQLGSRYLQGLSECTLPLNILVYDISKESLEIAEDRWNESLGQVNIHQISFLQSLKNIPQSIDLVIVSTNADVRAELVSQVSKLTKVKYWILEKILAQSLYDLKRIITSTRIASGVWVNTPRRSMELHQLIKHSLEQQIPIKGVVGNNYWGLACNSIHFLDLFSWWSGEELTSIDTSHLDHKWFKSKRSGFYETTGILRANYSGGSELSLKSEIIGEYFNIMVEADNDVWIIDEINGNTSSKSGISLSNKLENQSRITGKLVDTILTKGDSHLPTIQCSYKIHKIFLQAMLENWNMVHQTTDVKKIPIT